jgi:hypothetical protein
MPLQAGVAPHFTGKGVEKQMIGIRYESARSASTISSIKWNQ